MAKNIDPEIRAAIDRVEDSNKALSEKPSKGNQEAVCVETRAAFATFEDVTCWTGAVDDNARTRIIEAFREAVDLLQQNSADPRYSASVQRRLRQLQEFDLKKVLPNLDVRNRMEPF